ncbi:MAG: epoxyqueuosine reductase [Bacillota bacterium]
METTVIEAVRDHAGQTKYRQPVFGYADAHDPRFLELKRVLPNHLLPSDLLPGAQSVFCFFLPFHQGIVEANRRAPICAREWAIAYKETNALIDYICERLGEKLRQLGVAAKWRPATLQFDTVTLEATWSHKSVGVIAGLGTMGLHQMLITPQGCAGRIGSIVVGENLRACGPVRSGEALCGYYFASGCRVCMELCPVGAIHEPVNGISVDKKRCYAHLLQVGKYLNLEVGVEGKLDICGKCATGTCGLSAGARPA